MGYTAFKFDEDIEDTSEPPEEYHLPEDCPDEDFDRSEDRRFDREQDRIYHRERGI